MKGVLCIATALVAVVITTTFSLQASAESVYGRDSYGSCEFSSCTRKNTVVDTPGLQVAVNLTDGQVITDDTYTIIITPLDGAGTSFKDATIYIDSGKVAVVTPGQDGTASWVWDIGQHPGTQVRIVIANSDGSITEKNFAVLIRDVQQPGTSQPQSQGDISAPVVPETAGGLSGVVSAIEKAVVHFVRSLPRAVVYGLPYFIFILILIYIALLLLQTRRELRAFQKTEALIGRMRMLTEMKKDFLNLLAHYLRTPLTTLSGGLELQASDPASKPLIDTMQPVLDGLKTTIESIVKEASEEVPKAEALLTNENAPKNMRLRSYFVVSLPLLLAGLFVFGFVYLANTVTAYPASIVGMIIQALTYGVLCLVAVQIFRGLYLRKERSQREAALLTYEADLETARDTAIAHISGTLGGYVTALKQAVAGLPADGIGAKFIQSSLKQFSDLSLKCVAVTAMKGNHSSNPSQQYSLETLYGQISGPLTVAAAEKHINVTLAAMAPIDTPDPSLVSFVLQNLLDNAIAYSPENTAVEVGATREKDKVAVRVTDHGTGIASDKQAGLFQPFYKSEGSEVFSREGMGFSLYLDKLIMTYLGGDINVESSQGNGAVFTLSLPAKSTP